MGGGITETQSGVEAGAQVEGAHVAAGNLECHPRRPRLAAGEGPHHGRAVQGSGGDTTARQLDGVLRGARTKLERHARTEYESTGLHGRDQLDAARRPGRAHLGDSLLESLVVAQQRRDVRPHANAAINLIAQHVIL